MDISKVRIVLQHDAYPVPLFLSLEIQKSAFILSPATQRNVLAFSVHIKLSLIWSLTVTFLKELNDISLKIAKILPYCLFFLYKIRNCVYCCIHHFC